MPFLLLLLVAIVCLPESWPQPLLWLGIPKGNPLLFSALTWAGVAVAAGMAARNAWQTCRQLYRRSDHREAILYRHASRKWWHLHGLCFFNLLAVFVLGWGWTVQHLCTPAGRPATMLPGAELLILVPFFLSLVLYWTLFYDAERAIHDTGCPAEALSPFWGRWTYVGFHLRNNLALLAAPLLLLLTDKGLRRLYPEWQSSWTFQTVMGLLGAAIIVCLPWILRGALGSKPLPEGPLRQRLQTAARRLGFRCSNILLWNTHGGVANAMVAGFFPFLRYVLLSDRLVSDLDPEEVEAVFGHEIGHVKHRHMIYYLCFLFLSLAVAAGLWGLAEQLGLTVWPERMKGVQDLQELPVVALMGAYIFVVFGFLSRRCERQADVFGCRAVSCSRADCPGHAVGTVLAPAGSGLCETGIRIFIEALEKVARINGISRSRPGWLHSWQHSTIARRVDFLQRVLADPSVERRFQRTVAFVKWAFLLALGAALIFLGAMNAFEAGYERHSRLFRFKWDRAESRVVATLRVAEVASQAEKMPSPQKGSQAATRSVATTLSLGYPIFLEVCT